MPFIWRVTTATTTTSIDDKTINVGNIKEHRIRRWPCPLCIRISIRWQFDPQHWTWNIIHDFLFKILKSIASSPINLFNHQWASWLWLLPFLRWLCHRQMHVRVMKVFFSWKKPELLSRILCIHDAKECH